MSSAFDKITYGKCMKSKFLFIELFRYSYYALYIEERPIFEEHATA